MNCVLSIDVGIKNLAVCIIDFDAETPQILFWDVMDISKEEEEKEEIALCSMNTIKGKSCNRKAAFAKHSNHFCKVHAKSNKSFKVIDAKHTPSFLARQTIPKLVDIAKQYDISYTSSKKCDIISSIKTDFDTYGYEPIKAAKIVRSSEISLIELGKNILHSFDEHFLKMIPRLSHVIIENQISPIANRMKTIQGMIAQYFIMRSSTIHIEFVSSVNKLSIAPEEDGDEENTYKTRKAQGIKLTRQLLCDKFPSHIDFLDQHRKKDDLADSFLQGIWYLTTRLKKEI
jgi:hypothetical protein